ncbi:MAG: fatty acid CoA ligase family protein [Verrucomicrobiota bacterium]|nr:fatty acid CoA ligase family protein [Verrucomicrobiota bacterium]
MEAQIANVARFLPEIARLNPNGVAVRAPLKTVAGGVIAYDERTFAAMEAEAVAAARLLEASGVRRGTRTLLMVRPGLDLIRLTFALFKLGAVPIIIDPGMGLKSFLNCVRQSQPEVLIGIPLAQVVSRLFPGPFRSVLHRVAVGKRFSAQLDLSSKSAHFPVAQTQADDLAAILFTSGSTGSPKGVCYEHGMFEAQVRMLREHYRIQPGEVDLPMLPIFALFNPALGMTTIVPQMNPSRPATVVPACIVQAIRQNQVTNSFGSPVLWRKICGYCREHNLTLPSLKRVLMAGAPVPAQLIREFKEVIPNGEVHTPYGATECLPLTSMSGAEILAETAVLSLAGRGACVGRAFPGMEVRIMRVEPVEPGVVERSDAIRTLPTGEVGEIIARGPVVTKAYDKLPAETARAKIYEADDSLWHRVGDLGYQDNSGRFWFCGRKAERVVSGDTIYYTECCEAVFNQHPRVARTALIGLGSPGQHTPAIVVEPRAGEFPTGKAAQQRFEQELLALGQTQSHTRAIHTFFFHKHFPVDVRHNAKIHRLKLARVYGASDILKSQEMR